ncbi:MAG: iron(III) transport system ATP-binding protein [Pseudohongiellaceae bacterium]|jgi:iron(III) transport system ATP-binding protein
MQGLLTLDKIQCNYDKQVIIKDLSLSLSQGDIGCLLGPSGCGKSTILRAIAGFEPLVNGAISLNQHIISSSKGILAPEKRHIGMVFQDYALFPHLTIAENIAFGLKNKKEKHNQKKISELIELVNLNGYQQRYPHELSGGQQQRVALARALAPEPSLILLDEPFSNLDAELRSRLSMDIRSILKELNISAILVTHDQKEAFAMCDNIGVIDRGTIQQWGKPYELYHEPVNRFVACFIGKGSFIKGKVLTPDTFSSELGSIQGNRAYKWSKNSEVEILLRPDDIIYNANSKLSAIITSKIFAGTSTQYLLQLNSGKKIEAIFPSHQDFNTGDKINFSIDAEHLIAYPTN